MRQVLDVVFLRSQRSVSRRWQRRVWLLEHRQNSRLMDGYRTHGHLRLEDAVLGEELHLLQAGRGCGGSGGARAGVERVGLRAVGQSVLLQLQVSSQGVDVVNNLVTTRRSTCQFGSSGHG